MYTDKITQSVAEAVKKIMAEELSAKQKGIAKIAGDKSKIDSADLSALRSGAKPVKEGWQDMLDDVKKRAAPQPNGGAGMKQGSRYGGSKQKDEPEDKMKKEDVDINAINGVQMSTIEEKHMTEPEMKKREEIVKSMKKGLAGFKERYGNRAKNVMYATATKQAMKD
jgi:hypothetical protein